MADGLQDRNRVHARQPLPGRPGRWPGGASSWSSIRSTSPCCRCGPAGKDAGTATPHHITRHAHPKARPEPLPGDDAPRATGIDYLALLGEQHDKQVPGRVNYAALTRASDADEDSGSESDQDKNEDGERGGEGDSRG